MIEVLSCFLFLVYLFGNGDILFINGVLKMYGNLFLKILFDYFGKFLFLELVEYLKE